MKKFLQLLFPDPSKGLIELRCFSTSGDVLHRAFVETPAKATKLAQEWRPEGHVYFGLIPRRDSYQSKVAELEGQPCYVVWADIDASSGGEKTKRRVLKKALSKYVFKPTLVVDSGRGHHLYWLLTEPAEAGDELSTVVANIGAQIGGDSVSDIARIMRMPGTLNYKLAKPPECKLAAITNARYSLRDLKAATNVSSVVTRFVQTGETPPNKTRSERDWAIMVELLQVGVSEEGIITLFNTYATLHDQKGNAYYKHTLEKAKEKAGDAPRTKPVVIGGYKIVEMEDCYYHQRADGTLQQLSTFVFEPEVLLESSGTTKHADVLQGTFKAAGYEWPGETLSKEAFEKISTLFRELPVAAWQWLGRDDSVRALLPYLMELLRAKDLPRKRAYSILGRHNNLWIGNRQTITAEGISPSAASKDVWLESPRNRVYVQYTWPADSAYKSLLQAIIKLLPLANTPDVIYPLLGWYCATAWKPRLEEQYDPGVRFPHLNLFGTRGSGKTSMVLRVMQTMMGLEEPSGNDCDTTRFVLMSMLGSTNAVPVYLTEYRESIMRAARNIIRLLLVAYDSGHDARGRADQSIVEYPLLAPIIIDGEDAINDPACLERMIAINLRPETVGEKTQAFAAFNELVKLPLADFAGRWIHYTLTHSPRFNDAMDIVIQAFPKRLPDRVRRNVAVCVVGLKGLYDFASSMGVEMEEPAADNVQWWFGPVIDNLVGEYGGRTRIMLDELIEDALSEIALTQINNSPNKPFAYRYDESDNRVWLHLKGVMSWWRPMRRRAGQDTLEERAIRQQINERVMIGRGDEVGQYVVSAGETKSVNGASLHCFGIDLAATAQVLDVPERLLKPFGVNIIGDTNGKKN